MSLEFIGTTFGFKDQWGPQEKKVIRLVQNQINNKFGVFLRYEWTLLSLYGSKSHEWRRDLFIGISFNF